MATARSGKCLPWKSQGQVTFDLNRMMCIVSIWRWMYERVSWLRAAAGPGRYLSKVPALSYFLMFDRGLTCKPLSTYAVVDALCGFATAGVLAVKLLLDVAGNVLELLVLVHCRQRNADGCLLIAACHVTLHDLQRTRHVFRPCR